MRRELAPLAEHIGGVVGQSLDQHGMGENLSEQLQRSRSRVARHSNLSQFGAKIDAALYIDIGERFAFG
jgi:hypothetical protein